MRSSPASWRLCANRSAAKPFTLALCVSPARQLSLAASMMLNQLEMLFSQL